MKVHSMLVLLWEQSLMVLTLSRQDCTRWHLSIVFKLKSPLNSLYLSCVFSLMVDFIWCGGKHDLWSHMLGNRLHLNLWDRCLKRKIRLTCKLYLAVCLFPCSVSFDLLLVSPIRAVTKLASWIAPFFAPNSNLPGFSEPHDCIVLF